MPNGAPSEVEQVTGVAEQLSPEAEQFVDGESQVRTLEPTPLIPIAEPEKRMEPLPVTAIPGAAAAAAAAIPAAPTIVGMPVLILNRYTGVQQDWQELVRWDIPVGFIGDLHELSILSNDDAHTRYQVVLANIDQAIPLDRATTTPWALPWRDTKIPGGTSSFVRVRSTDGTAIIVDGSITGTVRTP